MSWCATPDIRSIPYFLQTGRGEVARSQTSISVGLRDVQFTTVSATNITSGHLCTAITRESDNISSYMAGSHRWQRGRSITETTTSSNRPSCIRHTDVATSTCRHPPPLRLQSIPKTSALPYDAGDSLRRRTLHPAALSRSVETLRAWCDSYLCWRRS